MSKKIHLLIIDPQQDFCDPNGALFVQGSVEDCNRLSSMISRYKNEIDSITVTLDSHHKFHISHPSFWVNSSGDNPSPFTPISKEQVQSGEWKAAVPEFATRAIDYVSALEDAGKYGHFIWPEHCLIGGWGAAIHPSIFGAINEWAGHKPGRTVNFVQKGSNTLTEHFSAIQAEIPDPSDSKTELNSELIQVLAEADDILIAGQALSHCVANSIRDIVNTIDPKKLVLITDTTSSVTGFEKHGQDFVKELTAKGMRLQTSTNY